jgi:hypothetical protein
MKFNFSLPKASWGLIAATMFAICFSAATANAQPAFQAKVTLPYEVHWGAAALPPGNYVLTFNGEHVRPTVVIRDAKTFRTVALEPASIEERSTGGKSALLIGMRKQRRVVTSFRIVELGQVLVYRSAPANRRDVEEANARKSQSLPLVIAEK